MWGTDSVPRVTDWRNSAENESRMQFMRRIEFPQYLPGTHVPVNGWFQPCIKCSELTARTSDEATQEQGMCSSPDVIFICGRCAYPNGRKSPQQSMASNPEVSDCSSDSGLVVSSDAESVGVTLELPQQRSKGAANQNDWVFTECPQGITDDIEILRNCDISGEIGVSEVMDICIDETIDDVSGANDGSSKSSTSECSMSPTAIDSPELVSKIPSSPEDHARDVLPKEVIPSVIESVLADFMSDKAPFSWTYWPCSVTQSSCEAGSKEQNSELIRKDGNHHTMCMSGGLVA